MPFALQFLVSETQCSIGSDANDVFQTNGPIRPWCNHGYLINYRKSHSRRLKLLAQPDHPVSIKKSVSTYGTLLPNERLYRGGFSRGFWTQKDHFRD